MSLLRPDKALTSLPNQQEKPHAPRQVYNQWQRIRRTLQ